jgi:PAS domain S-box-containing protein
LLTLSIGALSLIGYFYGVDQLFSLPYLTVIALQTTTFIVAVSLGMTLAHPEFEPMRTMLDHGAAGLLARRLVPPLVIAPVVLGYLRIKGQEAGLYSTGFGTALLVLVLVALLLAILWPPLRAVREHEQRDRESSAERARAEEALRASQVAELERRKELEALLGTAPAAIWVAHDPECNVITGNPAAAAMLRVSADRNMSVSAAPDGSQVEILIEGRRVSKTELPMQTAARTGRTVSNQELEFRFSDGSSSWVYGNAVPLFDAQNKVRGALGAFVDVTKLRRAQESLREADRRKDEFLATLAHELRNPLAPVRNAVEILRLKDLQDPETRWARDVIDRQVAHMVRLVDDLLDLSRINVGKITLARAPVEVAEIVRAAVEASEPLISDRKHELVVELPPRRLYVNGDATRLAQALCNLLNNAAKYSEPGGRVVCRVEEQEGAAIVTVRDNGIGIPPGMLSDIFAMFVQVDRSRANARGGLGIGLTLVKLVVGMHGGDIVAHSEGPGTGSTFVIRLPLLDQALGHSVPAAEPRAADPVAPRRVLVVDDNRDAADSLEVMLRLAGNDVRIAYDGVEAVRVAHEFNPSVVLLDLGMPRMNGYDAARAIRRACPGPGPALIAVTGWGLEEDRRRSKDAGFDHHLVKPVSAERLNALLASLPIPPPSAGARSHS